MKQFLFGFAAALLLIAASGLGFVALGLAPVATASAPLPFEKLITGIALNARVNREAPKSSPIPASDEAYAAGANIYRKNCAVCHGLLGQDQTAIGKGEFPKPPELFKGEGVTNDPVGVTYWKVANGIRLTGMPGFNGSLGTEQMWQVSLLLSNANKLPATVVSALKEPLVVQ
jgi:thiosulfate dehydrogenase